MQHPLEHELCIEQIHDALVIMQSKGIILDEDATFASKTRIKSMPDAIEYILKKHGYTGGPFMTTGKYHPQCSEIVAIFDLNRLTHDEAMNVILEKIQKNLA